MAPVKQPSAEAKEPRSAAQVVVEPAAAAAAAASKPAYDIYGEQHQGLQETLWSVTMKPRIPYRPPTGIGGILFPGDKYTMVLQPH